MKKNATNTTTIYIQQIIQGVSKILRKNFKNAHIQTRGKVRIKLCLEISLIERIHSRIETLWFILYLQLMQQIYSRRSQLNNGWVSAVCQVTIHNKYSKCPPPESMHSCTLPIMQGLSTISTVQGGCKWFDGHKNALVKYFFILNLNSSASTVKNLKDWRRENVRAILCKLLVDIYFKQTLFLVLGRGVIPEFCLFYAHNVDFKTLPTDIVVSKVAYAVSCTPRSAAICWWNLEQPTHKRVVLASVKRQFRSRTLLMIPSRRL